MSHICALGSSALGAAGEKDAGVIICASLLRDMGAGTLAEQLPADFDVVALSKNGKTEYMGNLITLTLPLDRQEFLQTVAVLAASKSSFTRRKEADEDLISNAKLVLMNTQDMTELQAHRFLQKESMRTAEDYGTGAKDHQRFSLTKGRLSDGIYQDARLRQRLYLL